MMGPNAMIEKCEDRFIKKSEKKSEKNSKTTEFSTIWKIKNSKSVMDFLPSTSAKGKGYAEGGRGGGGGGEGGEGGIEE